MSDPRLPTWLGEQIASAKARLAELPERARPRIRIDRHEADGRECKWMKGKDDEFICVTHNSSYPLRDPR